jgi:hypothetical protein
MNYEIVKAANRIYWLKMEDQYDMCMLFLRCQEFYESPNERFRGKRFSLLDFQEWYAKEHEGIFTYPMDWAGFNIPSRIIDDVFTAGIPDVSKYDLAMAAIHHKIKEEAGGEYYLIGSCGDELDPHEFAHACFGTLPSYRKEMEALVFSMPPKAKKKMVKWLTKLGYTEEVFIDEIQAYLIVSDVEVKKGKKRIDGSLFREVFRKFNADVPGLASYWEKRNEEV